MNRRTRKEFKKIDKEVFKDDISMFGIKEYHKKMLEIEKPYLIL